MLYHLGLCSRIIQDPEEKKHFKPLKNLLTEIHSRCQHRKVDIEIQFAMALGGDEVLSPRTLVNHSTDFVL